MRRRHPGPVAGGLNLAYNPKHHWYYYPDMEPDEVIAFRLYDTANPGLAHDGAHGGR